MKWVDELENGATLEALGKAAYIEAIRSASDNWREPWEWDTTAYEDFRQLCLEVHPFPPSKLNSAWFHSSVRRYWSQAPNEITVERLAYSCLMKGLTVPETVAVVGAWCAHHSQTLTDRQIDALIELVRNKTKYGKGAKRIKQAKAERRDKKTARQRLRRIESREAAGTKKRTTAQDVLNVLPESVSGQGDDLDEWTFNEGTPRTLAAIQVSLGVSYRALVSHLTRLKANGKAFKNGTVWFRLR